MRNALLLFLTTAVASAIGLPVAFEPNRGQEPGPAEFMVHTSGAELTLRAGRAEWITRQAHVAVVFASASRDAQGQGEDLLPGVVNYLIGNQPSAWHKNIPTYSRVRYSGLYPGIDVVYYVHDGRLEYDLVLARGADPNRIRLNVEGAQSLRVDDSGDLAIATAGGELRQHRPIVYQEMNGERRQVACRYQLHGNQVRFALARYDRSQPIVIDPALTWATYLLPTVSGLTTSEVQSPAVALDSAGNTYLAGTVFVAAKFNYCFVAKLSPSGAAAYVTLFGSASGDGDSDALAIAVSSAGNVYVAGATDAPDFDADTTYLNYYAGESVDGFVIELNNTASAVVFSHYFGGSETDIFNAIALDASDNVYLVGTTNSPDLPVGTTTGTAPAQTALRGPANAFVVEFSAAGSLIYSTYLGGTGVDNGNAIAVDSGGDAFVTGSTMSANFPTAGSPYQSTLKGTANAFVAKIAPNTGTLVYSTYLGGSGADLGNGIAVDSSGAAFITGVTSSSNFPVAPNPGAYQTAYGGGSSGSNAFVTRLAGSGSSLLYSTYLGGSGADSGNAVAIDSAGNAYVTGSTTSTNFPISDAFQNTNQAPSGTANAFVAGLNASGSGLLFSSYLGGNAAASLTAGLKNYGDSGTAVALNCSAGLVVAGTTTSTNLPATGGTSTASYPGGAPDAFVAQIAAGGGVPDILPGGIANNGMAGPVAPGAVVSIYGTGLAPFTQSSSAFPLPTSLAGVSVSVNGVNAPMYFASSGQINIQLPFEIPAGPAAMTVSGTCGSSGQVSFQVAQTAPYIVQNAGQAAVLNYIASTGLYTLNGPDNPAKVGSLVSVYLTGIGLVTNRPADGAAASLTQLSYSTLQSSASATISGWTSTVQFLGLAPGWVGLDQANLVVPVGLSTGAYPVVITVNGVESNGPTMYVTQ